MTTQILARRGRFAVAFLCLATLGRGDSASTQVPLTFSGGHETEGQDRGRPVILVSSGLGVPAEVFREAFSHVHPAGPGEGPTADEARANKAALMNALAKYGVTNERLDEVSNYYRYRRESGELWRHRDAAGYAVIENGAARDFVITDAGAGYSSEPDVSVAGYPNLKAKVTLWYGKELAKNGSVTKVGTP